MHSVLYYLSKACGLYKIYQLELNFEHHLWWDHTLAQTKFDHQNNWMVQNYMPLYDLSFIKRQRIMDMVRQAILHCITKKFATTCFSLASHSRSDTYPWQAVASAGPRIGLRTQLYIFGG